MQERRFLSSAAPPTATGRTIRGYAALYNSRSENLGSAGEPIFEIIQPGAFDGVLNDNCVALFNHDPSLVLARSKGGQGTLRIGTDATGLWYEFEAPATRTADDLLESIKRGDVESSSFGFSIAAGGERWTREGNARIRTITRIGRLYDVSPVTSPAYAATSVSARSLKPPGPHPSVANELRLLETWGMKPQGKNIS